MELLLVSAALVLLGITWVSRARFARRLNAAVDAYAEREISRESRRQSVTALAQDQ